MSDFARILAVHRHDADLHELREVAAELPGFIAKVEAKIAEAVHQRDTFTAQRDAAIHARRAQERRVEELDGERIRFEKQLQQVKKNEEYTALLKEIAGRVKDRDAVETKVLLLFEDEEKAATALKAADATLTATRGDYEAEIARLRGDLAKLQAQIAAKAEERTAAAKDLRPDWLSKYERILASRKDAAISVVRDGACGVCRANVPPQTLTRVKRQEQMFDCDDCGRILVPAEALEALA